MAYGITVAVAVAVVGTAFWVRSHVRRRWSVLKTLTARNEHIRFQWDGPFPILMIDSGKTSVAEANKALECIRRCAPRYLEVWIDCANDAHAAALAKLRTLEKLYLSGPAFTGDGLRQLAPLRKLEVLGLKQCQVVDSDLTSLLGMSELESLNLEGTRITADGLKVLAGLPLLKEASLDGEELVIAGTSKTQ